MKLKGIKIGKNDANDQGNEGDTDGYLEAVQNCPIVVFLAEKFGEICQRERAALRDERLPQQRADGVDEKQQKSCQQEERDHGPNFKFPPLRSHFAASISLSS